MVLQWSLVGTLLYLLCPYSEASSFMQCNSQKLIPDNPTTHVRDPLISPDFTSLVQVCGDYQFGLGLFCETYETPLYVLKPLSPLFRAQENAYLRELCHDECWCDSRRADDDVSVGVGAGRGATSFSMVDNEGNAYYGDDDSSSVDSTGGDDLDSLNNEMSNAGIHDNGNTGGSASSNAGVSESNAGTTSTQVDLFEEYYVNPNLDRRVICSQTLFGQPSVTDCMQGLVVLDYVLNVNFPYETYEFAWPGQPRLFPTDHIVELPWKVTRGTCTIMLHILPSSAVVSDDDNADYVSARSRVTLETCAAGNGAGGWARAGSVNKAIGIFVYGPNSRFETELGQGHVATADRLGNIQYDPFVVPEQQRGPDPDPQPRRPEDDDPTEVNYGLAAPAAALTCGNYCATSHHCRKTKANTIGDDCRCMYDPQEPTNAKHATSGFPVDASFGTLTCLSLTVLTTVHRINRHNRGLLETNNTSAAPTTGDVSSQATLDPGLACACNCTYVSNGCCQSDTGIVFEDASAKKQTTLFGPEGNCCDHLTGNWLSGQVTSPTDPKCNGATVPQSSGLPVPSA